MIFQAMLAVKPTVCHPERSRRNARSSTKIVTLDCGAAYGPSTSLRMTKMRELTITKK